MASKPTPPVPAPAPPPDAPSALTHLDGRGCVRMVDVTRKSRTVREATARAVVALSPEAFAAVRGNALAKGELIPVVKLAAIQGAKRAAELIPLAHPLCLTFVGAEVALEEPCRVLLTCTAACDHATGVEMEAMCGASAGALTVYDMVKGIDRAARIESVELLAKSGGKSGTFVRRVPRAGRLLSIHASSAKGVKKEVVPEGLLVADHGLSGDAHAGTGIRQLSLLPVASADRMRAKGAAVRPGDFAENLLVDGFETTDVRVGDQIELGPCLLTVTQIGKECHDGCWIKKTVGDCVMPREGFFVRVETGGTIRPGDPLRLVPGPAA